MSEWIVTVKALIFYFASVLVQLFKCCAMVLLDLRRGHDPVLRQVCVVFFFFFVCCSLCYCTGLSLAVFCGGSGFGALIGVG